MSDKLRFPCAYPERQEERLHTTFFEDFSIAECFGMNEIKDTWKRAFDEWKDQIKFLVELASVMNHKCWDWYNRGNDDWCNYYKARYYECYNYVFPEDDSPSKFTKEEQSFFYAVLD